MPNAPENPIIATLDTLRRATRHTAYEGELFLVGGLLRDRFLEVPLSNDLDIVLEGDAIALAKFLYQQGVSAHYPVTYPRFGTAMVHVGEEGAGGAQVELVSARAESYQQDSRKPDVRRGTLREDVFRRDFTINTLLENLHTGEMLDLTGKAIEDLRAKRIRTPLEPQVTFFDDPLRMLRAVRFAARFGFEIEEATWQGVCNESERLAPPTISLERIREEFCKIVSLSGKRARRGMELLQESRLLDQFLPEMLPMIGCTQGDWHRQDVWTHTLEALEQLPDSAPLETRLALLWHDLGKPSTRTEEKNGVRFYGHPTQGAEIARQILTRLKFSNDEIRAIATQVRLHMRLGEYRPAWTDASVRRLIRDCHPYLDALFVLTECDRSVVQIPAEERADLAELRARIADQNARMDVVKATSPLNGEEIMRLLHVGRGAHLREAKEYLTNLVIEGTLGERDGESAEAFLREWARERSLGEG